MTRSLLSHTVLLLEYFRWIRLHLGPALRKGVLALLRGDNNSRSSFFCFLRNQRSANFFSSSSSRLWCLVLLSSLLSSSLRLCSHCVSGVLIGWTKHGANENIGPILKRGCGIRHSAFCPASVISFSSVACTKDNENSSSTLFCLSRAAKPPSFIYSCAKNVVVVDNESEEVVEEEELRSAAAEALVPVLFPLSLSQRSNDKRKPVVDVEKALKRCLRRHRDSLALRGSSRKRLADLILGTSVLRLRHSYLLRHKLECEVNKAAGAGDFATVTRYKRGDNERVDPPFCNSSENDEAWQDENLRDAMERSVAWQLEHARLLVDLHAEYLAKNKDNYEDVEHDYRWPNGIDNPYQRLSVMHSLPLFIARMFIDQYGVSGANSLAIVSNRPGPVTLRRNYVVTNNRSDFELCQRLIMEDNVKSAVPLPFPPGCIQLDNGGHSPKSIWSMKSWQEGWFEVQDRGSQLVVEATEVCKGECIVDYCAGNGGKTLAMASRMMSMTGTYSSQATVSEAGLGWGSTSAGKIFAHDVLDSRLAQLRGSLKRAGLMPRGEQSFDGSHGHNSSERVVEIETTSDASLLPDGIADLVLVDAPCSSLGVLRRRPGHRWTLNELDVTVEFPRTQIDILRNASRLVRANGGRLVYATCSIIREENENVAAMFETAPEFEEEGWEKWKFDGKEQEDLGRKSHGFGVPSGEGGNWRAILPHMHDCDGFFIARWSRK